MNKMETTEEGSPGCSRCHATISTPDDHDPEDLCMSCAYDRILELEAEREVLRREIAKGDEAIVALTEEIESLRPVVEAVKAEHALRVAQRDDHDTSWEDAILDDERMCAANLEVQEQLRILLTKEKESA